MGRAPLPPISEALLAADEQERRHQRATTFGKGARAFAVEGVACSKGRWQRGAKALIAKGMVGSSGPTDSRGQSRRRRNKDADSIRPSGQWCTEGVS